MAPKLVLKRGAQNAEIIVSEDEALKYLMKANELVACSLFDAYDRLAKVTPGASVSSVLELVRATKKRLDEDKLGIKELLDYAEQEDKVGTYFKSLASIFHMLVKRIMNMFDMLEFVAGPHDVQPIELDDGTEYKLPVQVVWKTLAARDSSETWDILKSVTTAFSKQKCLDLNTNLYKDYLSESHGIPKPHAFVGRNITEWLDN
jgi:hypothetical protein